MINLSWAVNEKVSVSVSSDKMVEAFEQLSKVTEVLAPTAQCGCCKGTNLRPVVREVDDNKYYELHCLDKKCRAKFAFGQHKKGGSLFPKYKDKDDQWKKNDGWEKWIKPTEGSEKPTAPAKGKIKGEEVPF